MTTAPTAPDAAPSRFAALDALRGVAILMVVYNHLFAYAGTHVFGHPFAPVPWVRTWVTGPMGIIQDFGWLGVCLFFFISGFVIAHAGRREPVHKFVLRRVLRIYPPLAAGIVILAVIDYFAGTARPVSDYLIGMTLAGYFTVPQILVLGVAWTLIIEVTFYALIALVSPLLRSRWPVAAIALASCVPPLSTTYADALGPHFFLLAATLVYVPLLLIGSTLYLRRMGHAGLWVTALLLLANYAAFVMGLRRIHTGFLPIDNSYLVSAVYALVIFVLCLDLRPPRALTFVGDISYSLYLLHGTLGFYFIRQGLTAGTGAFTPYISAAACIVASYFFYRWVEQPSIALGRRLTAAR